MPETQSPSEDLVTRLQSLAHSLEELLSDRFLATYVQQTLKFHVLLLRETSRVIQNIKGSPEETPDRIFDNQTVLMHSKTMGLMADELGRIAEYFPDLFPERTAGDKLKGWAATGSEPLGISEETAELVRTTQDKLRGFRRDAEGIAGDLVGLPNQQFMYLEMQAAAQQRTSGLGSDQGGLNKLFQ